MSAEPQIVHGRVLEPQKQVLTMDQIAYYCATQMAERMVKQMWGLENAEWIRDTVSANCVVHGKPCVNVAELQFNYSLGVELEIIRYIQGDHWLRDRIISQPFIAHIGLHVSDGEPWPFMHDEFPLVQTAETFDHTANHLVQEGKQYSYRIYELSPGTYVKYIKRRYVK